MAIPLAIRSLPQHRKGCNRPDSGPDSTCGDAPRHYQSDGSCLTGKPTLSWRFDQAALAREQATDGWYGLLTNLDPAQVDAAGVLARYKGQEVVQRRYGAFKGPLAVAPLFVQSNRRIQALVTVICLALLVFCLVERQVRRAIAPASTLEERTSASRPSPPGGSSSRRWPACGCSRPAAMTRRSSPSPTAASPTAATAGRGPHPGPLTPTEEDPMRPNGFNPLQPLMCERPG